MPNLEQLISEVQALNMRASTPAAKLCDKLLDALLEAEGPPPTPIEGYSTNLRPAIARAPKGKPLFTCQAWQTGQWVCLMLDIPPVVMGRPIFLPHPSGKGPPRTVTDYQSQKFQKRIGAACQAHALPPPVPPCRLHIKVGARVFVAWAPLKTPVPELRGDLDNYAKNILDGLQRCSLLVNDRFIADLHISRDYLPPPPCSLEDATLKHLLEIKSKNPTLKNQRQLAKLAGLAQREARRLLRIAAATEATASVPSET